MKAIVKTTIGNNAYVFEIDEKDEMETLHKAAVLGNTPNYCDECGAKEGFRLDSNKDKEGNIYVNIVCACKAKAKLGQYKAGGYFWHRFEKYVRPENGNGKPAPKTGKTKNLSQVEVPFPEDE